MKPNIKILFAVLLLVAACKKDDSKIIYGPSNIYMPQAINVSGGVTNDYPVPNGTDTSTYNYVIDTVNHKADIILGAALSGEAASAGYTVDIQTNADTIAQLLATDVLDTTTTLLMPASLYTLPSSLTVAPGKTENTFFLSVDIAQLKQSQYAGKTLALAVKLANPSKYQLNAGISTTIVLLNVDALVIGPADDISAQYLTNYGPFIAVQPQSGRWGILQGWNYNYAVADPSILAQHADFTTDAGGSFQMERYGSPVVLNGKVWQTITLPAGTYNFAPQNYTWQGVLDPVYLAVAAADSLPDYGVVPSAALAYTTMYNSLNFTLSVSATISIGVVVNFAQDQQGFAFTSVKLFDYPKHL